MEQKLVTKPIGMSPEELSRTEFWHALKPTTKKILDFYFADPSRTMLEAVAIFRTKLMDSAVMDAESFRISEDLLKNPNVQTVIELRNGTHISQKRASDGVSEVL
jgi:hypothetical protein